MILQDEKIARFLDECRAAGIRNPVDFITAKMPQTYGYLKGAFPRGILPTDVDGEVELGGVFLRLEFKHESALRCGSIPKGQAVAFNRLLQLCLPGSNKGAFTVFWVGTNDRGEHTCIEIWTKKKKIPLTELDVRDGLYQKCDLWATWALNLKP